MSASDLRAATKKKAWDYAATVTEELITRTGDTEAQMRVRQGIIEGVRVTLKLMDDAYQEIG